MTGTTLFHEEIGCQIMAYKNEVYEAIAKYIISEKTEEVIEQFNTTFEDSYVPAAKVCNFILKKNGQYLKQ